MRENQIEMLLRGRKFKKMIDNLCEELREKYGLKQIELEILLFFSESPSSSASDIYRDLSLNKGQVSKALDSLCRKGYIQPKQDPDDRRYIKYEMDESCDVVIKEIREISESMTRKLFDGIEKDELDMIKQTTIKLCNNIDMICDDHC